MMIQIKAHTPAPETSAPGLWGRPIYHWVTGALILAMVGAGGLMSAAFFPYPILLPSLMNSLHFPAGTIITLVVFHFLKPLRHPLRRAFIITAIGLAALELVQPYVHRDGSLTDLFYGMAGSVAALLIANFWLYTPVSRRFINVFFTLVIAGFVWVATAAEFLENTAALYQQLHRFPMIEDFEENDRLFGWFPLARTKADIRVVQDARHANNSTNHFLHIDVSDGNRWPGMSLQPANEDWSQFGKLCFDVIGSLPSQSLLVRLGDQLEASYQNSVTLKLIHSDGWSTHCLSYAFRETPKGQLLNWQEVRQVLFYVDGNEKPLYVGLDNITLLQ